MNLTNRCRICLQVIVNDPVKISLNIYEFLENTLQINQVPREHSLIELPKNICFNCYEEVTKFKRFHQLCKDSEEFLKSKIELQIESQSLNNINCKVELPSNENSVEECALYAAKLDHQEKDLRILNETTKELLNLSQTTVETVEAVESDQHLKVNQIISLASETIQIAEQRQPITEHQESNESIVLSHTGDEIILNNATIIQRTTDEELREEHVEQEEECLTLYEESVEEDQKFIEYQLIDSDTEGTIECLGSLDSLSDANDKEEQVTIQECEILNYDSYDEQIEISFDDAEYLDQTKDTQTNKRRRKSSQNQSKKVYPCRVCGKVFNTGSTLRSHEYIHSDARPFICEVCGKAFRQGNVLVTHMALHTGKKVECELCGKKFARKSHMILHNRMHKDEKPFVCDYPDCNASFRQNQYLLAHKEKHTGVKRHQCTLCGRRFFNRPSLLGHMHRVHGSIYYQCDMCIKEFKKSIHMQLHLKNEHQIEVDSVAHLKKRKMKKPETES